FDHGADAGLAVDVDIGEVADFVRGGAPVDDERMVALLEISNARVVLAGAGENHAVDAITTNDAAVGVHFLFAGCLSADEQIVAVMRGGVADGKQKLAKKFSRNAVIGRGGNQA